MERRRLLARAYVGVVLGIVVAIQVTYFDRGVVPGDASVYLAAGERLNAGHPLYELSPGDRPADINSRYWRIPLVSPPPIAVVWRPLASFGEAGVYGWWLAQVAALLASLALLLRRRPVMTATALLLLAVPFVYEFAVGNVNSFILLALLASWRAATGARMGVAGSLTTLAATVKVTPAMVVWWTLAAGGRAALPAIVGTAAVALAVSLVGAGVDNHLAYIAALTGGAVDYSPLSLPGMLRFLGAPGLVVRAILPAVWLGAPILIWRLRRRPARAFQVAVVAMIAASPAVSINWFVFLLALLAPAAWPYPSHGPSEAPTPTRR